ncbi:Serine protease [Alloactinosynnema sp. L-07]|uniref:S8 family serine peptidase n=1 Tax=Alloactinosynnema sp. L-07 TaxID=1653480 RepID=UPI00065EF183|nr:S8 family serine peptidase [Alloactinosynnema sp. L-07]CRK56106.1 Serine protease [Alloactinosynnema sp. L-07]
MGRRIALNIIIALAASSVAIVAAPVANAEQPGRAYVENVADGDIVDQYIVTYKPQSQARRDKAKRVASQRAAGTKHGVAVEELRDTALGSQVVRTDRGLDAAQARGFLRTLAAQPDVEAVEPDSRFYPTYSPNDTYYGDQWHYWESTAGMRLPTAWDTANGAGSVVAVIDTGRTFHPDLDANTLPGYDFISSSSAARDGNGRDSNPQDQGDWVPNAGDCGVGSNPSDSSWHGTHVAGTIAAVTGNGSGVAGVAPNAKVLHARVLGFCGGALSDIADAIIWASGGSVPGVPANANPAKVINMSLGGGGACGTTYQNAINSAVGRGSSVIVAAGNSNIDAANTRPANCGGVITVAATDRQGNRASYSNYGAVIDVSAPGGETATATNGVLSAMNAGTTTPGGSTYEYYQGTSMATPHVAGLVALMLGEKSMSPASVESSLKANSRPLPGSCSGGCGAGLVDAAATIASLGGGSGQVLANPGFESGNTSWTASSGVITTDATYPARTGSWKAWLCGYGATHTDTVDQTVSIPSGATSSTLSFYLRIDSAETGTTVYDTLKVQILSTSGAVLGSVTYSNADENTAYALKSINMNSYIGQTVKIRFTATEDADLQTSFVIDDTALTYS